MFEAIIGKFEDVHASICTEGNRSAKYRPWCFTVPIGRVYKGQATPFLILRCDFGQPLTFTLVKQRLLPQQCCRVTCCRSLNHFSL